MGHPVVGPGWEGLVVDNILSTTRRDVQAYTYRTSACVEIDLVLVPRPDAPWAVEVKRTLRPGTVKAFLNACEDSSSIRHL